ncbi:MAG: hypothetical protein ACYCPP_09425 [Nitrososphaerales archaeon]
MRHCTVPSCLKLAGIKVEGQSKWLTLIQNAAKSTDGPTLDSKKFFKESAIS